MRRRIIVALLVACFIGGAVAALAGWHDEQRRARNKISHFVNRMDHLHRAYQDGQIEIDGLTLVFSEAQKDSIKAAYNRLVDSVTVWVDSLEYAP